MGNLSEVSYGADPPCSASSTPREVLRARQPVDAGCTVSIYRLRDITGDDLGLLEHPAPNLEPGDVVVVADGRERL
jgi:hypothetical protein